MTMICDIKSSRKIKNREDAQYRLIATLKEANDTFVNQLAVPFIIVLGDEWEGLLKFPCNYNDIIDFFHQKMVDIDFYCGLGIGAVSISNFEMTVNQLDGPSFYKARKAINIAKANNYKVVLIQ